jgi:hypothetical protein
MSSGALVQVVAVAMALVLVLRTLRARNLPTATLIRWSAIWLAIIAALALLLSHLT